jgi:hypothetical protein
MTLYKYRKFKIYLLLGKSLKSSFTNYNRVKMYETHCKQKQVKYILLHMKYF